MTSTKLEDIQVRLESLNLGPNDILIVTIPPELRSFERMRIHDYLQGLHQARPDWSGVFIVTPAGIKFDRMSDEDLAQAGLQRIPKEEP